MFKWPMCSGPMKRDASNKLAHRQVQRCTESLLALDLARDDGRLVRAAKQQVVDESDGNYNALGIGPQHHLRTGRSQV